MLTGPDGATVCRMAMPITAEGTFRPAQGPGSQPGGVSDDPRWERPLPWVGPVEPYADPLVQMAVAATLINVCIPVAILWLATRRRFWSVRLLLALPVVAAILLTGYSTLSSLILDRPQMSVPRWWDVILVVILLTMGGVPIVAYATAFVLSLVRLRWLKLAAGPPGRGRHSCCGVFGPASLDPRSTSIGRTSVVGNPSCGGLAVDERIADRGLRGRARFIRGPPAVAEAGASRRRRTARGHSDRGDHALV